MVKIKHFLLTKYCNENEWGFGSSGTEVHPFDHSVCEWYRKLENICL